MQTDHLLTAGSDRQTNYSRTFGSKSPQLLFARALVLVWVVVSGEYTVRICTNCLGITTRWLCRFVLVIRYVCADVVCCCCKNKTNDNTKQLLLHASFFLSCFVVVVVVVRSSSTTTALQWWWWWCILLLYSII